MGALVTGVASTRNIGLVRSLGAEQVIDYTQANVLDSGNAYDVGFDTVGSLSASDRKKLLAAGGSLVFLRGSSTHENADDLRVVRDLLGARAITAVVDRRYRLEQIREAHAYVEEGHKTRERPDQRVAAM